MTDNSGKTWMAIGETDDPNAEIETFTADAAIVKGDPVYLSADDQVTPAGAAQDCIVAYNFPVNSNVQTEFWCRGATYDYPYYWIDEIWVIAK